MTIAELTGGSSFIYGRILVLACGICQCPSGPVAAARVSLKQRSIVSNQVRQPLHFLRHAEANRGLLPKQESVQEKIKATNATMHWVAMHHTIGGCTCKPLNQYTPVLKPRLLTILQIISVRVSTPMQFSSAFLS